MTVLQTSSLSKTFTQSGRRSAPAVDAFTHSFADGRITTVLGPSGSGKSTTLWMIAGLRDPDAGAILLDGQDITRQPAERRPFGVVFQNYALFPHLNVLDNAAFGLRVRGVGRRERRRLAGEALDKARVGHLADRRVHQLSGGEQQRVALARALAYRPRVLLLDEPLSALDARLREELRGELLSLLGGLGVTTVYVTHDQVEALSLGSELIVMNAGRIEQAGPPSEVYDRPASLFVARFLGGANVIDAVKSRHDGRLVIELPFGVVDAPAGCRCPDGPCSVIIRPEAVRVSLNGEAPAGDLRFDAQVESAAYLGANVRLTLSVGRQRLLADVAPRSIVNGTPLRAAVSTDRLHVLPRA